jgi:predicted ATPase
MNDSTAMQGTERVTELVPGSRGALTGGPGAGKTTVLELVRRMLCEHVNVLPEAAGVLFGGGFPRGTTPTDQRAAQRAIFYVQRELEATATDDSLAIVLCDRGTIDGEAYWPGPDTLLSSVGTTLDEQLARYAAVIHLRVPDAGYNHVNPLRTESPADARALDERITQLWSRHPRRYEVPACADFFEKSAIALRFLIALLPASCRRHLAGVTAPRLQQSDGT